MPEVAHYEPRRALDGGSDGYDAYRSILPSLGAALAADGTAILEVGAGQADHRVGSGVRTRICSFNPSRSCGNRTCNRAVAADWMKKLFGRAQAGGLR